ncbi:MAG: FAD-dependent pyridine nucleotide-disulfide oxidoreductase (modular protein) [Nitrososphaeraceae archaeon]|nr:FAD-dependent pyridine nucleotide-disulfide oxidoreductase (modular protein) [Nitrososphaeraceae archaeon]
MNIRIKKEKKESTPISEFKIDFSFRREVLFIIAGALMGAIVYVIPITVFAIEEGSSYYLTWIVFGHIAGVYSNVTSVIIAGFMLHVLTATCIGIIAGLFLYKTNILNISKPSNGLKYGLFVGSLVFVIFAIPVQEFVLGPEFSRTIGSNITTATTTDTSPPAAMESSQPMVSKPSISSNQIIINQLRAITNSLIINLVFGITLGLFSSFLSRKFGARYRCPKCDISFSRVDSLQHHLELVHGSRPIHPKRILILGGGFAGVEVLRRLQDRFQNDVSVDITMVSKDNFFLFTPMLHEVASGMIETRHIVTPIRAFCNRAKFYAARVESIDLKNRQITIESPTFTSFTSIAATSGTTIIDREEPVYTDPSVLSKVKRDEEEQKDKLSYDYLVIALGSETKFFGMADIEEHAFTIKTWNDAIVIRNHVIHKLEQAELVLRRQPYDYNNNLNSDEKNKRESLLTFVIVGGGFAGVETAGELNDFLRDAVNDYYHNIEPKDIQVIIIQSGNRLLPEMSEELAEFAMQKLIQSGVKVILNARVIGATANSVKLKDGRTISTNTIIWSGGVASNPITEELPCEHDAIGDCAFIIDQNTGNPYPPTAQHAIREGTVVANNTISLIEGKAENKKVFDYKTKGMMASIGKRNGIGSILGLEVQGFIAWWIWRTYYLANLPTLQKKIRVMADWTLDIFFKRDVTMLKSFVEERKEEQRRN